MTWPMDVMSVGEVNDEGVPLDMTVNTRLSRVCGLDARQRVSITLQGFNDLTKNEKDGKKNGKKVATKNISHAWRSYKNKLVNIWRDQDTPFCKYKDVTKED
jgi:hypothetical protein